MTWWAGIDPGSKGAVAFLDPDEGKIDVHDLPIEVVVGAKRLFRYVDAPALVTLLRSRSPALGYLERVHAMPHDGAVGAFTFGDNFGTIKGVFAGCGVALSKVSPDTWKKALRVPADKTQAVKRALEVFPSCEGLFTRPDRAEAALICLYGLLHQGIRPKRGFEPLA